MFGADDYVENDQFCPLCQSQPLLSFFQDRGSRAGQVQKERMNRGGLPSGRSAH